MPATSAASTSSREMPSTDATSRPSTETPAASTTSRPSTESPAASATSRPSTETPAASTTSRPSTETPAASTTSRPAPGINWALQVAQAGARIEQCGTYLGGWEAYLRGHSEFLRQLAGFAPEGRFPAAVVCMAGACSAIGQALGHVAGMVKGASELCILVGGAIQRLIEGYVPGMAAEPQSDVENPSSAARLVIVSSVQQLEEVLVEWNTSGIAFAIDVDPHIHFSIGNSCYERLQAEGQEALQMIRTARHIKLKRAEYLQAQQAAGDQSPPAPGA